VEGWIYFNRPLLKIGRQSALSGIAWGLPQALAECQEWSWVVMKTPKVKSQRRSNMSGDEIKYFAVGSKCRYFVSVGYFSSKVGVSAWFRTINLLICGVSLFAGKNN
jgi:hypothetical protein